MDIRDYIKEQTKYLSFGSFLKANILFNVINLIGWMIWIVSTLVTGDWGISLVIAAISMLIINLALIYSKRSDPYFTRVIGWNIFNFSRTSGIILGIGVICILLFASFLLITSR